MYQEHVGHPLTFLIQEIPWRHPWKNHPWNILPVWLHVSATCGASFNILNAGDTLAACPGTCASSCSSSRPQCWPPLASMPGSVPGTHLIWRRWPWGFIKASLIVPASGWLIRQYDKCLSETPVQPSSQSPSPYSSFSYWGTPPLSKSIWQFLNSNISPRDYCRTYRKILGSILLIVIMVTSRPPHHLLVFMRIRRRINWVALYFGLHFIAVVILTPLHELDPHWEVRDSASDILPFLLLPFIFLFFRYFWGFAKWCLICFKTKKKTETERLGAI